jgi:DNA-directed RNA polymerase I subunit RPA1
MWSLADELVDLDKLYTSDIYAILQTYGVEACRTAIINEMAAVFGVYGIKVDYRHRTVIADYMVSPFSSSPSFRPAPLLFASFKSSKKGRTNNRLTLEHIERSTEQI